MSAIIDVEELQRRRETAHFVILDCRFSLVDPEQGFYQYQQDHISGALYVDLNKELSSEVAEHGGRHPLPTPEQFSDLCRQLGVRKGETEVVVYDNSRFAFASRAWWLFKYFGHQDVRVLDGGYQAWKDAGGRLGFTPVDRPDDGIFEAKPNPFMVAERNELLVAKQPTGHTLLDAREPARFRGEQEPIDPIAGHIPAALNYPWQDLTDEEGWVQPTETRFDDISPPLVVYCGSGVTACVTLLALELAGVDDCRLYPGSWSDWCSYL
ncbi:Putative thiosulfate sulfurtransferase SseB [Sinobacterium norvegicum]|uniref:Thiosulfate sulfurtransferase SseB n=1 Tax=Sinobacterium norvegicum TaxID=1641715 RepID=A0ABN8EG45_9GAMM|nr:sulfurtransferase [Sinobacterium norvegicum]CAH0991394.1 Putative thiosulfate sulfurtransferase SseB [Sinobacterium norvegicum]